MDELEGLEEEFNILVESLDEVTQGKSQEGSFGKYYYLCLDKVNKLST